ncbi:MAG: allophanate hydrolase [Treponema sp.]|nr:allophanate hydrolase [Treponema sp.]
MKYFPERLSFEWLKSVYESGEITPQDVVDEIITRSMKYMEKNIWIVSPERNFIAPYLDSLPPKSEKTPLWGIPFAIKDNIDLAGIPTTAACPDFSYIPEKSATVVQKLIEAGAIPVGKTNLDQFATGLVGTRSPYGECHNAYQDEMISGGSSSGSAVSVALGLCCFALGTDTAGSGRVPAMLNSIVGYKPPVGAWSTKGVVPACASLDCVTVFAGTLEDALRVDEVARGYDSDCIWSRKIEKKGELLPAKIYIPKDFPVFYGEWKDIYASKWKNCVTRIKTFCCDKNIKVEEIDYSIFHKAALILYEGAYVAERWEDLKDFVVNNPGKTFHVTEKILKSGNSEDNTAAKLFGNLHELQMYKHMAAELLSDAVMVMPTAGGSFSRNQVRDDPIKTNSQMGLYTNHCNLLDMAAVAIPENSADRKYPFGITLFSLYDRENFLCAVAKEFLAGEKVYVAVCGLHKKGFPLEYQLTELRAEFIEHAKTSESYRMYRLNTIPVKPGLVKSVKGKSVSVDVYALPEKNLGSFMKRVKAPLCIGDIILEDGREVKGFLCEESATKGCEEILEFK